MSRPLLKGCSTDATASLGEGLLHGIRTLRPRRSYHRGVTEQTISFVQEEPMPVNIGLMS